MHGKYFFRKNRIIIDNNRKSILDLCILFITNLIDKKYLSLYVLSILQLKVN